MRDTLPTVIWSTSSCCCLLGLCGRKADMSVVKVLRAITSTPTTSVSNQIQTALLRQKPMQPFPPCAPKS